MSINNPSQSGKIGKATGGTSGSILFVDSSGNLAQDNSNLFWDDTNNLCYISSPTFSARKAYLTVRNASNYPEASLTQGLAAGYGGILALYDGTTAGGTGSIRLEYNVGYPQMITTSNNFTFTTSAGSLTFASTYIQQMISGNAYYLASSDQAGNKFTAGAASQKVVVVQGRASQSANLQEWQDSSGTVVLNVSADGTIQNGYGVAGLKPVSFSTGPFVGYKAFGVTNYFGTVNGYIFASNGNELHLVNGNQTEYITVGTAGLDASRIRLTTAGDYYAPSLTLDSTVGDEIGFYLPSGIGSNTLAVVTERTNRMVFGSTGNVLINGFSSSTTGLTIKGAASQTATLQEWQNSSGTQLAYVTKDGQIYNNVQAAVANLYLANAYNSDCINVSKTGGTGNVLTAALVTSQSHGIYMTNTSAGTYLQGGNQYGVYSQTSHACDNPAVIAGNFIAAHTATASGTYGHLAIGVNASAASSMTGGTYGAAGKFTCASANVAGIQVVAHGSQTSNLQEWQDSGGTALSYIRKDGSLKPASLTDASAANDSIYYSTTASKLVYKDSGGTVNALY